MKNQVFHCAFEDILKHLQMIETDCLLVVVDHTVWSLYSERLNLSTLKGKVVHLWKAVDGEKVKNLNEYSACVEFFLGKGIHRKAHLVAIGGGATSDFGGFVASTLLRGISWTVIPTTLLSMVDAAVGGKVGVNTQWGKNLIGAFHSPDKVLVNHQFLASLPIEEQRSGKGEVLKYGLLSKEISNLIEESAPTEKVILECLNYKISIVSEDPYEQNIRKYLNLGHTFGHGIERIYQTSHGEAVVWGMLMILSLFESKETEKALKSLARKLEIGIHAPPWRGKTFPHDEILSFLGKDKKRAMGETVDLVLLKTLGQPSIKNMSIEEISNLMQRKINELKSIQL